MSKLCSNKYLPDNDCESGQGCCSGEYFKKFLTFACCADTNADWSVYSNPSTLGADENKIARHMKWAFDGSQNNKCKTQPDLKNCGSEYGCCSEPLWCAYRSYLGEYGLVDGVRPEFKQCEKNYCNWGSRFQILVCFGYAGRSVFFKIK